MAGKRNSSGQVQAPSLKEAVDKLISELGVEEPPPGWFALNELAKQSGLPIKRLQRKLNSANVPKKLFRVVVSGFIRSTTHYFITK
jgi:hypothetical protein